MSPQPLRFGPPGQQLFGLWHVPSGQALGRTAVLCPPFGQEALRSHRLYRLLAERLVRNGWHVLRFDLQGSGDADGDGSDVTLSAWVGDMAAASRQAAALAPPGQWQAWFGLRLGASLAVLAAAQPGVSPPQRLVLLDPVFDGTTYLAQLAAAHVAHHKPVHAHPGPPPAPVAATALEQALGFAVPPALRTDLLALSPRTWPQPAVAQLAVLRCQGHTLASPAWPDGPGCRQQLLPVTVEWAADEALGSSVVPAPLLQALLQTLEGPP